MVEQSFSQRISFTTLRTLICINFNLYLKVVCRHLILCHPLAIEPHQKDPFWAGSLDVNEKDVWIECSRLGCPVQNKACRRRDLGYFRYHVTESLFCFSRLLTSVLAWQDPSF